ncbi:CBS domain-containing protein [Streptomyces sp. NPDC050211]|uniref:CBS domain-containing protein n=1 Tax=Streptomyces sp. NPDC050211 TaxID=3154932 RepID=UPI0034318F52
MADAGQVVVGLLHHRVAAARAEGTVEDAMRPGPATVRADEPLVPLLERMTRAGTDAVLVTDPEGRLLGLLEREDLQRAVVRASAGTDIASDQRRGWSAMSHGTNPARAHLEAP